MSYVDLRDYTTKPTDVIGAEVTLRDFQGIASWCGGQIQETASEAMIIKVRTDKGLKTANLGDFIVQTTDLKFQVWTRKAFLEKFMEV